MEFSALKEIARGLPFFKTVNEREKLLGVVSALALRQVSLSKAAEIMGMGKEAFLELLDAMRVEFSYLEESDVEVETEYKRLNISASGKSIDGSSNR